MTPNARPRTALIVIDMQRGVVAHAHAVDTVVANINTLIARARASNTPVVWVRHNDEELAVGSNEWKIVEALQPAPGEVIVEKQYGDSFEETDLESILAASSIGRVVVTGAQSDACIRSTLHGALVRGYDTMLVGDAHTTEDLTEWGAPLAPDEIIAFTNFQWNMMRSPGRRGSTVLTADVDFTSRGT